MLNDTNPGQISEIEASSRPQRDNKLAWLAAVTSALTLALVGLGSTVRVTNSGMGCPSWPLCYDQLGPIYHLHPILEESHRYLASIVSVLVIATYLLARRSKDSIATKKPALLSLGLVILQVLLGGLTVLAKNAPWTVTVHLIVGLIFLSVTVITAVVAFSGKAEYPLSSLSKKWGAAALASTLILLLSGSIVVAAGAGAACPTWPVCFDPGPTRLIYVALAHRFFATVAAASIIVLVAHGWSAGSKIWRAWSVVLLLLLAGVASLGAASALTKSSPFWADIHLIAAGTLWVVLTAEVTAAREKPKSTHGQPG
ncbi:MAG: heme A synthase [Acidimicrobiaceae bacterium]|nr:heme A synthase [Acidimicrobiaceae bacterium]